MAVLLSGVLASVSTLNKTVKAAREKTILASLVAADLEIVRNLPYSDVGTVNGNPSGSLPDQSNPRVLTFESKTYHVYYEVAYIDDPADGTVLSNPPPQDSAPNDYKQVKMFVRSVATGQTTSFLTTVSPQGLEGLSSAGALNISVINAVGQPVPNANVRIENLSLNPDIILNRVTDAQGRLVEVGLPASVNGYHVVVTKTGYSSDQTYPITVQNPNPIKPDATIVTGQVTSVSFAIDLVANLTIRTVDQQCQALSSVNVNVKGAKRIGINPDVLKFDQNFSSGAGNINMNNIEWDTYTPALQTGQSYNIRGTSPIQQINVLPASTQTFTFVLGTGSPNSLRVIVKDAATGNALEGAAVHLIKGSDTSQEYSGITGGSVWLQSDWSGGFGQADWVQKDRYFSDDGNIDTSTMPTGVRLKQISGQYAASGRLESSTFDTGTDQSNYSILSWDPAAQHPATTLRFQVATSNDIAGPWDDAAFRGPDGTVNTFYTVAGSNMSTVHDSNRYVRYRAYLSTTDNQRTPVLSNLSLNYVSGCTTPGQYYFGELNAGNNWNLDVSQPGYTTQAQQNVNISGNLVIEVLMSP